MDNKYVITLYNRRYEGSKQLTWEGSRQQAEQVAKDYIKSQVSLKPFNEYFVESLSHWFIGHKHTQF